LAERVPRNGQERDERAWPADETGLEKICLFPEKLAALVKGGLDPLYPVSVELSLTSRCNLHCLWCSERALRERCPDQLSLAILENLFQDLVAGGARGVTIEGGGEPTLAPFFPQAARAAVGLGLKIGLITNGLSLFSVPTPVSFYQLFQWIRVSLDATNPEEYARLKGRDGFNQALDNLKLLAQLPGTTLGVGYVLTNQNDDPQRLFNLAERLKNLGVAYLHLRPVVDHPELSSQRSVEFLKDLETPKFAVNTAAMTDNQGAGNDGLPCLAHSLATVITADGAMWLCGRLCQDPEAGPLGYLTKTRFPSIWGGPARTKQALMASRGDFCQGHCPPCRMTKYNRLLNRLERIRTRDFI
jgi:pyruvate-formate lyase-activating enzyme